MAEAPGAYWQPYEIYRAWGGLPVDRVARRLDAIVQQSCCAQDTPTKTQIRPEINDFDSDLNEVLMGP